MTGIEISRQRILCHGAKLDDFRNIRVCGITPGTQLQLFTTKEPSRGQHHVTLACSAKRRQLEESQRLKEERRQQAEVLSQSAKALLEDRNASQGYSPNKQCVMPPMVFQDSPNLFSAETKSIAKGTSAKNLTPFEASPIYIREDPNSKLDRVRSL